MNTDIKKDITVPKPIGPYSIAASFDRLIFTSGQIGIDPVTGVMLNSIEEQTRQVFKNLKAVLESQGSSLRDIIKANVFLNDINDFVQMNNVYKNFFESDYPARSAVEVARLPKDALIEIEVIAVKEV